LNVPAKYDRVASGAHKEIVPGKVPSAASAPKVNFIAYLSGKDSPAGMRAFGPSS